MKLKITHNTWLKRDTRQASVLPPSMKYAVNAGAEYPIVAYRQLENNHIVFTLGRGEDGLQSSLNGFNTWYAYAPHVSLIGESSSLKISDRGLELIKEFEGLHRLRADGLIEAYRCPAGVPTIGYGSTKGVSMGMLITKAEADRLLREDVAEAEAAVRSLVDVPLTQGQIDSLVSFIFNCGVGAFRSSTLLRLLNQGKYQDAAEQLLIWDKVDGRSIPGLSRRRRSEKLLFEGKDWRSA